MWAIPLGTLMTNQFGSSDAYWDLHQIFKQLAPSMYVKLTPQLVLFLGGGFTDRGRHSIEVVAFLFAWKLLAPDKVTLVRGNQKDPTANGDPHSYGEGSLLGNCHSFVPLRNTEEGELAPGLWEEKPVV